MCGLGCKIGLTVESEEGEVPHLRWSQAPPLPWPRPGSADIAVAISALAGGGAKTISHRDLVLVVFACFFDNFWVSELKRVLKRNFGSFWSASGKGKTDRNEKTL